MEIEHVQIEWRGRCISIEHAWIHCDHTHAPLIVFLHEGLGSLSMWRDFPRQLCARAGARGLVYSRPGYGQSTPRPKDERWDIDFMHRQAHEVLPALFQALGVNPMHERPWLFGHSDGGSIALLYAAASHPPAPTVAGIIVLAPHIVVEALSIASITQARQAYVDGDLRQRLAKHHADPDSAFGGWNDAWLSPAFRGWTIEQEIASIACPVLAIQGQEDKYGTLAQIDGIAERVAHTQRLMLSTCGHSPHRDQPDAVLDAASTFIRRHHTP